MNIQSHEPFWWSTDISNLTVLKAFPGSFNEQKLANSEDPDQTAPQEQSDLDLHLFAQVICPNIK